ncbi:MAG: C40 family peptidase, partial [Clostridia bacterium]|nr:C40 family peptidase [Clostridia bacterium]
MKKRKTLTLLLLSFLCVFPLFACEKADDNAALPPVLEDGNTQLPPENSSPPVLPETPPLPPTAEYIRCTGDNVNIRSGAGTNYSVLGRAEKGTMYAVIGKSGNWYQTYYKNKTAYIYAEYATLFTLEKTERDSVEAVVEEGYKLLGVPYVYGAVRLHDGKGNFLSGFTTQKFDCSSLIQYIFYKGAGKKLDVTTRTQVKQGAYVHPNDLQRGDCIYFTNEERQYKTGVERVGHVALYLGNNYILHTASDYARIEKMSAKRWSFYIEARRFV